ncbi:MAG TPA: hypothetical protein VNA28_13870, partial [Solirubrobacteraceae bacterium]|nr:hypothetical protein [Solirubrobacteraceae bacterium]
MPVTFRPFAAAATVLLSATALSACGGTIAATDRSAGASALDSRAAADRIIEQAVGDNPQARSGRISGSVDVDIDISGLPLLDGQTQITADGVYVLPDGASVPDLDIDVGLIHNDHALGGAIVLDDRTGYVKLGTSGYRVPDDITRALSEPAVGARNGLTKLGAMFYINPQDWQRNARLVGETTIAGETVQHIKADISPQAFFLDLSRMVRALSRLRVPQALGLPTELGPKLRAALARSVTVAKGEAWIGKDDHVLRKARAHGKLVVAERDRDLLYGLSKASIAASLDVTEVGAAHTIAAPRSLASYSSLQLALSALAESV